MAYEVRAQAAWERVHGELTKLAKKRAGLDHDIGRWLIVAHRTAVHAHLGYASYQEYIERLFGWSHRLSNERLRVAQALDTLPKLGQALGQGQINWSVARELTRVATEDTEQQWLEAVTGRNVKQVHAMVAGLPPGARPGAEPCEDLRRHVIHSDVSALTLATFREAIAMVQRESAGGLSEDEAILTIARRSLQGPSDPGRSSYQVALTVCPECDRGHVHGRGELIELGPEVVEMARCDAQEFSLGAGVPATEDGASPTGRASQGIAPATRHEVMRRDGGCCVVSGCRNAIYVDVHHLRRLADGGDHAPNNLVVLCSSHHARVHAGQLFIEGSPGESLVFLHADGTSYGGSVSARTAAMGADVFLGLRTMGFSETEARRAVTAAGADGGANSAGDMLRQALRVLRPLSTSASVCEPRTPYRSSERISRRRDIATIMSGIRVPGFAAVVSGNTCS